MTPVPIPCSRNAHDQNVLVRRPQWDQHGCHSKIEASELGRIIFISQLVGSWLGKSRNPWLRSFSPTSFHGDDAPRAFCRRSGDPPRFSWEGKLELTDALRLLSQPREFQKVSTQENPEGSL